MTNLPAPDPERPSTVPAARGHFIDLAPIRESPAFARLWFGSLITGIGGQLTFVAVSIHIFDLTGSTLAVSLVAAFALFPMIAAGLYGGALADSFDRRKVALISAIAGESATVAIALLAWFGSTDVWPLYLLITVVTVAATMNGVARQAIVPRLVRRELLPAAGALNGLGGGIMVTVGPALAGVLVATVGISWTYTVDALLFIAGFLGIYTLPATLPEGERRRPSLRTIGEGLTFLRTAPNIRASFVLDIFAMTFGNPRSLLPAVGAVLIGGGAVSVGILNSSFAVGALVLSLLSGRLGRVRAQGRGIVIGVVAYGLFIALFGVVLLVTTLLPHDVGPTLGEAILPALVLAALFLVGAGAADSLSMIYRNTMLQAAVPDEMRGRLQGIFTVVVTGGPRIGDLYVGVLGTVAVLWFPPLLGGLVIVVATAVIWRVQRTLRDYDSLRPTP